MKFYSHANILITDESSVMYEALLFNLPTLSCEDWPMRINNKNKPRKIKKDNNVCNYTYKKNLGESIIYIFNNLKKFELKSIENKKQHFSYINKSASNIALFLNNYPKSSKLFNLKPSYRKNYLKSRLVEITNYLRLKLNTINYFS